MTFPCNYSEVMEGLSAEYLGVFDVEDECEDEEEEASTAAPSESSESVVATLSTTSLHSEVVPR